MRHIVFLFFGLTLTGCGEDLPPLLDAGEPQVVDEGASLTLTATLAVDDRSEWTVAWTTSDGLTLGDPDGWSTGAVAPEVA
jgi:hypothetical protein